MTAQLAFRICLVLGGARSGKTQRGLTLAEALHRDQGMQPVYLATAEALDAETADRIAWHRDERGEPWRTVEAPLDAADALADAARSDNVVLLDCLTMWLSNLIFAERDIAAETGRLTAALHDARGPVVVVSNEVGLGIVPENALARRFRDEAGRLNQAVVEVADRVEFIAAGLPLVLKG